MRKSIPLISNLCQHANLQGWRQGSYNLVRLKKHWRKAQKSHRSRRANAEAEKKKAHKAYLHVANLYCEKIQHSAEQLQEKVSQQLSPDG